MKQEPHKTTTPGEPPDLHTWSVKMTKRTAHKLNLDVRAGNVRPIPDGT